MAFRSCSARPQSGQDTDTSVARRTHARPPPAPARCLAPGPRKPGSHSCDLAVLRLFCKWDPAVRERLRWAPSPSAVLGKLPPDARVATVRAFARLSGARGAGVMTAVERTRHPESGRSLLPCPPRRPFLSLSLLSAASHARGSRCPRLSTHPPWSCSLLLILRPVAQASLPQKVFLEEDNDKDNKSQGRLLSSGYQVPRTILDAEEAAAQKKVKSFPLRVTFQGERGTTNKQTNSRKQDPAFAASWT